MKIVGFLTVVFFSQLVCSQADIPEIRQYTYSTKVGEYYFYLESESEQSINWREVNGYHTCYALVINNTADSVLITKVGSRNDPLYWFLEGTSRNELVLPNDTIRVRTKWARRHGPFSRPLTLQYRSSSNLNTQFFSVLTGGFFVDSNFIKRNQENIKSEQKKQSEKAKQKRQDFLKDHFENGQVKEVINKNPQHDSIPFKTTYYENGKVRLKVYKRKGIVKEAILLIYAMPNWEPATFKGERCVSKVQIPILFKN